MKNLLRNKAIVKDMRSDFIGILDQFLKGEGFERLMNAANLWSK
jgi:hypothetical protein